MDLVTLITVLGGIVGILGFLYLLFVGQKTLFEWLRERQERHKVSPAPPTPPKPDMIYLSGELAVNDIRSYELHKNYVNDVDWIGEDCRRFVSVSDDATIKIACLDEMGRPSSVGESNQVKCVRFIPRAMALIYGVVSGEVKYLEAPNHHGNTPLFLFEHPLIRVIDFGRINELVATGGYNRELRIHRLDVDRVVAEEILVKPCSDNVRSVAWSGENSQLAYSEGYFINLVQVDSTGLKPKNVLSGHAGTVGALSWSKDDIHLASGDENGNIIIWNPISGKSKYHLNRWSTLGAIRGISFHPHWPNIVAVGGTMGMIEVIHLTDIHVAVKTLRVEGASILMFINRIRWSSSGDSLLLACSDAVKIVSLKAEQWFERST